MKGKNISQKTAGQKLCVWCVGDKGMTKRGGVHVIVVINLI